MAGVDAAGATGDGSSARCLKAKPSGEGEKAHERFPLIGVGEWPIEHPVGARNPRISPDDNTASRAATARCALAWGGRGISSYRLR